MSPVDETQPDVGTRWKSKATHLVWQIIDQSEGPVTKTGYTKARIVSSATGNPIGGIVQIPTQQFGQMYKEVPASEA